MYSKVLFPFVIAILFFSFISVLSQPNDSKKLNKNKSPQIYVFGGMNGIYLPSASHYNSSPGEWKKIADMSFARAFHSGAVVGTKIYLFGGNNLTHIHRTAEIFDCESKTFSPLKSIQDFRAQAAAAVLDGHIYIAGGHDDKKLLSSVMRYNIETGREENVSPMLVPRRFHQLVELGGRLYAISGLDLNSVEAYNATTDRWVSVASTHYRHSYFGAAVLDGKIYVCSWNGFEAYSPEADEWETLTPLNSVNYVGRKLVAMGGKLWALGGDISIGSGKAVYSYDPATKNWTERTDMNIARSHHTAFVVNH